jgi:ATP-dependent Clp protease ATP-binding subunit ClpC
MFERYTEQAKRVIFFARYEAGRQSSPIITCTHLLLGLTHDPASRANLIRPFGSRESYLRSILGLPLQKGRPGPSDLTMNLPLELDAKRALGLGGAGSGP